MDEESIFDANNVTEDTFSHTYNTQGENENAIFTSEKLDKLDYMEDVLKGFKINNAGYYASNSATESDTQGNITRDPKRVTHNSNEKEKLRTLATGILNKNV